MQSVDNEDVKQSVIEDIVMQSVDNEDVKQSVIEDIVMQSVDNEIINKLVIQSVDEEPSIELVIEKLINDQLVSENTFNKEINILRESDSENSDSNIDEPINKIDNNQNFIHSFFSFIKKISFK